ncbi:MAG: flagellar hook capping FlgD N-terminal domain-containing protein, partial [Christensenellales bacterium]
MSTNVSPLLTQALQSTESAANNRTVKKKSLDMDDFLKLFVTQMTYQDPL